MAEVLDRGVLKAPVDCSCSLSKISCSSLGRRGGAGDGVHAARFIWVVENGRRKKPGRTARTALATGCMVVILSSCCSKSVALRQSCNQIRMYGRRIEPSITLLGGSRMS